MGYIRLNSGKIEEILDQMGWSCNQVARNIKKTGNNISVATVARAARGERIYRTNAKLIADALGRSVAELKQTKWKGQAGGAVGRTQGSSDRKKEKS